MSKIGRKQKYTTEELEAELSSLINQRDYFKAKRKFEHATRKIEGQESKVAPPTSEEVEVLERISAVRSVLYKRRK